MSRKTRQEEENEFYRELDEKAARRSFCTWPLMILLFLLLLVIMVLTVVFAFRLVNKNKVSMMFSKDLFSSQNFKRQIAGLSRGQADKMISITITEDDLSSWMRGGIEAGGFKITSIIGSINDNSVDFNGEMIKPFHSNITVSTIPEIKDSEVRLTIRKVYLGKLPVPYFFVSSIDKVINSIIHSNLASVNEKYIPESAALQEDKMIIFYELK